VTVSAIVLSSSEQAAHEKGLNRCRWLLARAPFLLPEARSNRSWAPPPGDSSNKNLAANRGCCPPARSLPVNRNLAPAWL